MKSIIAVAGLAAIAQAYTPPVQPPSYGALLTPDLSDPVTTGQTYQVTWSPTAPTDGVTVSLVLCNGPSSNCVLQNTAIASGIPAAQASYSWSVPCSLPAGTANSATGYGMLIIVDGTGQFQYSTQFSVLAGSSCGTTTSSSSTTTTSTSTSSSSLSSSSSSSSSSSKTTTTSSASGSPAATSTGTGWYGWSATTFNTTATPAPTASTGYQSWAVASTGASASYTYPSGVTAFTGAAAMPTAFVNAAGIVGAAALAVLAL